VFDDKLNGAARCIRLAAPPMRQRQWDGSSTCWAVRRAAQPAAMQSGATMRDPQFDQGDRQRSRQDNVLINAVIPSVIHSERLDDTIRAEAARTGKSEAEMRQQRVSRIPLGRMGEGREVGAVVAFLASERASFVTGCAWNVDGGASAVI
jgi:3-oxoacyl-[acyl-carrier protein] reductase